MPNNLINAIVELDEESVYSIITDLLEHEQDPKSILNDSIQAMSIIGIRYTEGKYFLPELLIAGEIMTQINNRVLPLLPVNNQKSEEEIIVIGTVRGDIHDIGKNIVRFMLEANGFSVVDLGVDVPAETFIKAIIENGAQIVGMSSLLTIAYESMKKIITAIDTAGLRDRVKIMIGGATIDHKVLEHVQADAYGSTAQEAVNLAHGWVNDRQNK